MEKTFRERIVVKEKFRRIWQKDKLSRFVLVGLMLSLVACLTAIGMVILAFADIVSFEVVKFPIYAMVIFYLPTAIACFIYSVRRQ